VRWERRCPDSQVGACRGIENLLHDLRIAFLDNALLHKAVQAMVESSGQRVEIDTVAWESESPYMHGVRFASRHGIV
jgi:signal transduction histidine kinase